MCINRIGIIGLGLMGGSLALGLKKKGYEGEITGFDLNRTYLEEALADKAIDRGVQSIEELVNHSEVIFVSTPVGTFEPIFNAIEVCANKGLIVSDLGSVKKYPEALAERIFSDKVCFVGGHPMVGSEKNGFGAATATLYENAYYFLCEKATENGEHMEAVKKIEGLLDVIGAVTIKIDAEEHDSIVAKTSHIPHLNASLLVDLVSGKGKELARFVGGGFKDSTRIAAGEPKMWCDIFTKNKEEVLKAITLYEEKLDQFKQMLIKNDEEEIIHFLNSSKEIRDSIPKNKIDSFAVFYELAIDVEDRPGIIGEVATKLGQKNINIVDIEIVHARENVIGALKIHFNSEEDLAKAKELFER